MHKKARSQGQKTHIISFRVSSELLGKLQEIADHERDEAGLSLNPSTAARRLMLERLVDREALKKRSWGVPTAPRVDA